MRAEANKLRVIAKGWQETVPLCVDSDWLALSGALDCLTSLSLAYNGDDDRHLIGQNACQVWVRNDRIPALSGKFVHS